MSIKLADPYSLPCVDCNRDVNASDGPFYPDPDDDDSILCAECGEKREAAYFNTVIIDRDAGAY